MGRRDSKTMNMVVKKGFQDFEIWDMDTGTASFSIKTNIFGLCLFLLGFAFWKSLAS